MTIAATCPRCGRTFYVVSDAQIRGGKARWKDVPKARRSEMMRAVAKARWAKHKKQEAKQ